LLAADACFVRRHHYASDVNIDNSTSLLTPLTLFLSRLPPGKCRAHAALDCAAVGNGRRDVDQLNVSEIAAHCQHLHT
jgi:hypothetical protein